MSDSMRDQFNVETPLTCPLCGSEPVQTVIRDMGAVTRRTMWQMHAGRCEEHGWFQAEIVGKPPREIFAVHRPFGASRRLIVGDKEMYQFPTTWNDVEFRNRMNKEKPADPLDPQFWQPLPLE